MAKEPAHITLLDRAWLRNAITELRLERERLNAAITAMERLAASAQDLTKRRGRPPGVKNKRKE